MKEAVAVVKAWHDALNGGDIGKLMTLVAEDVMLSGPRGETSGAAVVGEWVARANIKLYPLAYFAQNQTAPVQVVVVEENGEWYDPQTQELTGQQNVATVFHVAKGRVTRITRHDTIEAALDAARLSFAHQVA